MRSLTLLLFLLLTTTVFSQETTKTRAGAIPPPPPLTSSKKESPKPSKATPRKKQVISKKRTRPVETRKSKSANLNRVATKSETRPPKTRRVSKSTSPDRTATKSPAKPAKTVAQTSATPEASAKPEEETTSATPFLKEAKESKPVPMGDNERIPFMAKKEATQSNAATDSGLWMNLTAAVAIVLGLLFVGVWIVKKFGLFGYVQPVTNPTADLELIATISPRPGQNISVVSFNGESLLVGSTDQGFTLLSRQESVLKNANLKKFPTPVPVSSLLEDHESSDFSDALATATERVAAVGGRQ